MEVQIPDRWSVFLLGPFSGGITRNPKFQGSTRRKKKGRKCQKTTNKIYITGPKSQHESPFVLLHTDEVEEPPSSGD